MNMQTPDTVRSPAAPENPLEALRRQMRTCIQCGTCTGSCPNAAFMDMTPRQLWRRLIAGKTDEIFSSHTFALCSACYCCTLRCPRELPLTEVMARLKQIAFQQGRAQDPKSCHFYGSFLESVRRHGRVRETEFMMLYFLALKNPLVPLQYSALGLRLMRSGKIHMQLPNKGRLALEPLFKAVEQMEEIR